MEYRYLLMFEESPVQVLSYPLEAALAEKLETVVTRGIANTRGRNYYDIHMRPREFAWVGDHVTTALPGSVGLRSEHLSITRAMGLSMFRNPQPRPVATLALSLTAQARASGTPSSIDPGMPSRLRPALRDSPANAGVRQRLRPREPASACHSAGTCGRSEPSTPRTRRRRRPPRSHAL